ncbi:MAG: glycoside hydrolase family 78 protein [Clostridiales bacterium]|jgi:alpha-L-rhamnosidase|nr:glycoside hydrolase family 78 protein [Clostridiales bacterium]
MLKIIDLTTEYEREPLNLHCARPRFSWRYAGVEAFTQRSYRILAASSPELLSAGRADKWDSGDVRSRACIAVPYGGAPLKSRERCYWKVLAGGAESEAARFETGLLQASDWRGLWVSAQASRIGGSLLFRRGFDVGARRAVRARAYVAGLGYHEFYCNGKKVGKSVLNPSVTEYAKRVPYCAYAFEGLLVPGANAVGVIVGNGWAGARRLLAQIHIEFEDGSEDVLVTANCAGWWVTGAPIVADSVYDGEVFDGRIAARLRDWCMPDYAAGWESGWMYAMLCEPPAGKLVPHRIEPVEVVGEFMPVAAEKKPDGAAVYDFGQNFSGWARIRARGGKGAKIALKYGEQLTDGGYVNQLNLRTAKARDLFILNGEGAEEYAPRFTYHGFRYVEARAEGGAEILSLIGEYVRNAAPLVGSFECSDPVLNLLHRNAVMTEGSNLHGVMTDCPQRDERFGWLNDLSSRVYQSVCNYSMPRVFAKVTDDISDTQDAEGRIADTAPFFTGFRPADPVVVCYLLLGYKNYEYYGDAETLKAHYGNYKRWTDFLTSQVGADGATLYSTYGDWCPPGRFGAAEPPVNRDTPDGFVSIVYYYLHLRYLSEIAAVLKKRGDAERYAAAAARTAAAIERKYYDRERGVYATGSQSCAALALNVGLLTGADARRAAAALNAEIARCNYHAYAGNQAYRHMFEALTRYGYADTVRAVLTNPEYPGWGYMAACGATTVWERWEKEMQLVMHSFCHPMFASYDAWMINDVAGIRPDAGAAAMDKILIAPTVLSGVEYASGAIGLLRGRVACSWKRDGDSVEYEIEIPPNTSARVRIAGIEAVGGKPFFGGEFLVDGGGKFTVSARDCRKGEEAV